MDNMKMKDALKFVQSFALTSYSCTKLLAILDADETPLQGELLEDAKKAAMFVKGYILRGATGGDKVFYCYFRCYCEACHSYFCLVIKFVPKDLLCLPVGH